MNKLPNFRKTVLIEFSSLRNGVSESLGIIPDVDTIVQRYAYRSKTKDGWKWQIRGLNKLSNYDWFAEVDQETLDNCDRKDIKILTKED